MLIEKNNIDLKLIFKNCYLKCFDILESDNKKLYGSGNKVGNHSGDKFDFKICHIPMCFKFSSVLENSILKGKIECESDSNDGNKQIPITSVMFDIYGISNLILKDGPS